MVITIVTLKKQPAAQHIAAAAAIVQPAVAIVLAAPLAERHAQHDAATVMFQYAQLHAAAGGNSVEKVENCNLFSL